MKLSIAANIRKLRKEHAMTQEQLAEALGVTFAAVSKWERGVATPELNLIAEMAEIHLSLGEYDKGVEPLKQKNPKAERKDYTA